MRVRDLINALGGPKKVAGDLGIGISVVGMWSLRDVIAPGHRIGLWRLAVAAKVDWKPKEAEGLALVDLPSQQRKTRKRPMSRQSGTSAPVEAAD